MTADGRNSDDAPLRLGVGMAHRGMPQSVLRRQRTGAQLVGAIARTSVGFGLAVGRSRSNHPVVRRSDLNTLALRPPADFWYEPVNDAADPLDASGPSGSGRPANFTRSTPTSRGSSPTTTRPADRTSRAARPRPTWTDQVIARSSVGWRAPELDGVHRPEAPPEFVATGNSKLDELRILMAARARDGADDTTPAHDPTPNTRPALDVADPRADPIERGDTSAGPATGPGLLSRSMAPESAATQHPAVAAPRDAATARTAARPARSTDRLDQLRGAVAARSANADDAAPGAEVAPRAGATTGSPPTTRAMSDRATIRREHDLSAQAGGTSAPAAPLVPGPEDAIGVVARRRAAADEIARRARARRTGPTTSPTSQEATAKPAAGAPSGRTAPDAASPEASAAPHSGGSTTGRTGSDTVRPTAPADVPTAPPTAPNASTIDTSEGGAPSGSSDRSTSASVDSPAPGPPTITPGEPTRPDSIRRTDLGAGSHADTVGADSVQRRAARTILRSGDTLAGRLAASLDRAASPADDRLPDRPADGADPVVRPGSVSVLDRSDVDARATADGVTVNAAGALGPTAARGTPTTTNLDTTAPALTLRRAAPVVPVDRPTLAAGGAAERIGRHADPARPRRRVTLPRALSATHRPHDVTSIAGTHPQPPGATVQSPRASADTVQRSATAPTDIAATATPTSGTRAAPTTRPSAEAVAPPRPPRGHDTLTSNPVGADRTEGPATSTSTSAPTSPSTSSVAAPTVPPTAAPGTPPTRPTPPATTPGATPLFRSVERSTPAPAASPNSPEPASDAGVSGQRSTDRSLHRTSRVTRVDAPTGTLRDAPAATPGLRSSNRLLRALRSARVATGVEAVGGTGVAASVAAHSIGTNPTASVAAHSIGTNPTASVAAHSIGTNPTASVAAHSIGTNPTASVADASAPGSQRSRTTPTAASSTDIARSSDGSTSTAQPADRVPAVADRAQAAPAGTNALAQRFLHELAADRRGTPAALPTSYRPMAETIAGTSRVMLSTDTASRRALRSVGKVAATTDDVIHLDPAAVSRRQLDEVIAHELTHVAHPSPAPRFFDDDDHSPEERTAERVAAVIARSPLAPNAPVQRSATPPAPPTSDGPTSSAPNDVIRRSPAAAASSAGGTMSASALAASITGDTSNAAPTPAATPRPAGSPDTGSPNVIRRSPKSASVAPAVGAAQGPAGGGDAVQAADEQFRDMLERHMDRVVELVERRLLESRDRHGGSWRSF